MTVRGACDSHVHVYDQRYPTSSKSVLRPPDASLDTYRVVQAALGLDRVVLVQPTTYGLDNRCQLEAVAELGDAARAVVVVDDTTTDAEVARLTSQGGRGARFHMLPGGAVPWEIDLSRVRNTQLRMGTCHAKSPSSTATCDSTDKSRRSEARARPGLGRTGEACAELRVTRVRVRAWRYLALRCNRVS